MLYVYGLPQCHLFSLRVINNWNGLPDDIVNDSIDLFKASLDRLYYTYQYDIV